MSLSKKRKKKKNSYYRDLEKIEHEKHSLKYRYINNADIPRIIIAPMIHPIINPMLGLVSWIHITEKKEKQKKKIKIWIMDKSFYVAIEI